jgi:dihydroceramide fatty acyl 2-hydroxylase
MIERLATFSLGLLAWTLLEYAIHAWLSHTFETFASPLHRAHHRDAHAVFTIGAWIPVAVSFVAGLALFGWASGMIFYSGMGAGFIAYEAIHYRLHFAMPTPGPETYLRLRHLSHHECAPDASFGVTSALWDLLFGTEMFGDVMVANRQRVAHTPPLEGASNVRNVFDFSFLHR